MKILILNSDSAHNRGDRAILFGIVILLRKYYPLAEIWALSNYQERDEDWFGINFLPYPVYDPNPLGTIKLLLFARGCDAVLWGGGGMLGGYSSFLTLSYWVIRVTLLSLVTSKIYGVFQGVSTTYKSISKRLITFVVNRTKGFLVRDKESKLRLEEWGVKTKVINTYDPAILLEVKEPTKVTKSKLLQESNIDENFLSNFIGVAPRKWFHHKKNPWIPNKYRPKTETEQTRLMYQNMAKLCDWLSEKFNKNIIFFPMHIETAEDDSMVARKIISFMNNKEKTRIIEKDIFSPEELLSVFARAKLFFGVRLHPTILATLASVPSFDLYYQDKGRVYFEQIGCSNYALPIEYILSAGKITVLQGKIEELWKNQEKVKEAMTRKIGEMRDDIQEKFQHYVKI